MIFFFIGQLRWMCSSWDGLYLGSIGSDKDFKLFDIVNFGRFNMITFTEEVKRQLSIYI